MYEEETEVNSLTKKWISGILTVCMVLSLIPLSVFATGTVSIVNLTVAAPIAGKAPATTATLPDRASSVVLSVKWSPADPVFKENTDYTVIVELGIKQGLDKAFAASDKMSVKVNKDKTKNVEKSGNNLIVKYTWNLAVGSNVSQNDGPTAPKSGFSDVQDGAYYASAVKWAVDKKITSGTSATTFSPDDTCTRAQILTFLWRAVNSPKKSSSAAFNDVKTSDYYYNAAMWAKEKNMVSGTLFDPNTPCTRAFTVLYLWKNAGSPETAVSNVFLDVDANADYAKAVAWAVKNGVTSGTSATTFSPNDTCTRGQIVTFLNRALAVADNTKDDTTKTDSTKKDNEQTVTKPDETAKTDKSEDQTAKPSDTDKKNDDSATKPSDTDKKNEPTTKPSETDKSDTTTKPSGTTTPTTEEIDNENNWRKPGVFTSTRPAYDRDVYESAIQKALKEALGSKMGANMTDLQKALALHEWLVLHCRYDETLKRKYAYSEYGAIVEGFAVCQGYTLAYNDLLTRVGIEAEYVAGWLDRLDGTGGRHSWSRVTIDGKKYFVDVTADDVTDIKGRVTHGFFMVSDKELYYHSQYMVHCTDTTYDKALFQDIETPFFWDEDTGKFYYVDTYSVKSTSDFTEKITPVKSKNDHQADCAVMTDDKKYIAYFRPTNYTSEYPLYLYSIETGEQFTYKIKDVKNAIFCGMRLNGYDVEVVREYYKNSVPYMTKVMASVSIPKTYNKRSVTFDLNYSGGKTTSCEYLDNNWTNGNGSFAEPTRQGLTFGGWYTEKDGGTKIENFEDIPGDNTTLYVHWWGDWKMTEKPTLTEEGKAVRVLDGYPNVTEEKTIPNLSDTSVWRKAGSLEPTADREGKQKYTSEYGDVVITLPKKAREYGISYKDGSVFISVLEETTYTVEFKSGDSSGIRKVITNGEGEYRVLNPKNFTPSGTVKATLYDSDMKEICSVEYEVK